MGATDILLEDHRQIRRLAGVILACHRRLDSGGDVPLEDMLRISRLIDQFLDCIHYSREEDSYFPCVAGYGSLNEEIRKLLIEHEFSRRISRQISRHLEAWRRGQDSREPVSRYMKTYWTYLNDHMEKEERFLERASRSVLDGAEERHIGERFGSMDAAVRLDMLLDELTYLEGRRWCGERRT